MPSGIVLQTPDGKRHAILFARVGTGISISSDASGNVVLNTSGGAAGAVTSLFGRTGDVTALEGDYSLDMMADVVILDPQDGDNLTYDLGSGTWVNRPASGAAGSSDPLALSSTTSLPSPLANKVYLSGRKMAGRVAPWATPEVGPRYQLQPHLARMQCEMMQYSNGATAPVGTSGGNIDGTATYATGGPADGTVLASNFPPVTMMPRVQIVNVGGSNTGQGHRTNSQSYWRGTAGQNEGGFYQAYVFHHGTLQSDCRVLIGCSSLASAITNNPSALVAYCHGALAKDSTDTNYQFLAVEPGVGFTKVNLGVAPAAYTSGNPDPYLWEIFCAPGTGVVYYRLSRFCAGTVLAEGSVDVASTPGVNPVGRGRLYCGTGNGPGGSNAIWIMKMYGERYF